MLLLFIAYLLLLLTIVCIGIIRYKLLSFPFRILAITILITFISEALSLYLGIKMGLSFPVYHFYVLISFWLYSIIFQLLFKKEKIKLVIIFVTIPFTIFSISNSIFIQGIQKFPSISIVVSSIFLVVYALFLFRQLIDKKVEGSIVKKSYFWFNVAVLIFFSSQIFNWGIYNYLLDFHINPDAIVIFGYIMSVIFYSVLGFSLLIDSVTKPPVNHVD